ncbi:hypothetical protein TrispH2_000681 [Trichoplax sp. H2]|nr:hypothetical protein TrispH2_000681 [Trichoplax sp. H2]|eukprot:RDD47767.1 hypothetical protein TrispH2_000681 [Trichoplax sp. H2]
MKLCFCNTAEPICLAEARNLEDTFSLEFLRRDWTKMADQDVSLNEQFRKRIAGYMKVILICNSCKLVLSIGALVVAIMMTVNFPSIAAYYHVFPLAGASVTIFASAAVVYVFISEERKEHFISNVNLYLVGTTAGEIPMAIAFAVNLHYISTSYLDNTLAVVYAGIYAPISSCIVGTSIWMQRVKAVKWLMLTSSVRNTASATADRFPPGYGFSTSSPSV